MTMAAASVKVVVDASYKTIPFISIDVCIHLWLSSEMWHQEYFCTTT